jgi:deoxyribose-phosphate aldolase
MTKEKLAQMIDHTNLKAFADDAAIKKLCDEAKKYNFKAVAINGAQIERCKKYLEGSQVHIGATVGFPLGQMTVESKVFETEDAIAKGAHEIDYVLNVAELKNGNTELIEREMRLITEVCRRNGVISKVIFENCYLTREEKLLSCKIACEAGVDFVKTSTGFGTGGATVDDVRLMREAIGPEMGLKAAGGIRTCADALAMLRAGATRLGTSAGRAIVEGLV